MGLSFQLHTVHALYKCIYIANGTVYSDTFLSEPALTASAILALINTTSAEFQRVMI